MSSSVWQHKIQFFADGKHESCTRREAAAVVEVRRRETFRRLMLGCVAAGHVLGTGRNFTVLEVNSNSASTTPSSASTTEGIVKNGL